MAKPAAGSLLPPDGEVNTLDKSYGEFPLALRTFITIRGANVSRHRSPVGAYDDITGGARGIDYGC